MISALCMAALRLTGATEHLGRSWMEWRMRSALRQVSEDRARLDRLESDIRREPRLAPLRDLAESSIRESRRHAAFEAGERAVDCARERFDESRRLAGEGTAIVAEASSLEDER